MCDDTYTCKRVMVFVYLSNIPCLYVSYVLLLLNIKVFIFIILLSSATFCMLTVKNLDNHGWVETFELCFVVRKRQVSCNAVLFWKQAHFKCTFQISKMFTNKIITLYNYDCF